VSTIYRIRDLREDANISQTKMAELLHLQRTTYTRYERGEREVPLNIAILIAKFHNVSLDYLARLTNKRNPFPKSDKK